MHQHLAEHRIARELADGRAVGGEAVVAAVLARHHDGDHLALELRQPRGREHEIVVERREGLELGVVVRIGAQHVRHEADLLVAFREIGLHLPGQLALGEGERRDPPVDLLRRGFSPASGFRARSFAFIAVPSVLKQAASLEQSRRTITGEGSRQGGSHAGKSKGEGAGARPVRRGRRARRERRAGRAARVRPHALRAGAGGGPRALLAASPRRPRRDRLRASDARRAGTTAPIMRLIDHEVERGGARRDITVDRGRQRQHAVPARFDPRRARRPGLRAAARRASDPRRRARRERRPGAPCRRGDRGGPGRRPARELHPDPPRPHRRRGGAQGASSRGWPRSMPTSPSRCATGPPCGPASPRRSTPIAPIRRRCRADEVAEAIAFLDWVADDNFTFLGMREYRLPEGDAAADPVEASGLGLLRDPDREGAAARRRARHHDARRSAPSSPARRRSSSPRRTSSRACIAASISTTSASSCSRPSGRLQGELRLVGLFTANAYTSSLNEVPYLRHKVAKVTARAGFDPASYSGRALLNVLENYPRDELFQIDEETLYRFAIEIMNLSERPRIRALARVDEFDRFVSVLVFIPKDRYDTGVRRRIGEFLAAIYKGRMSAAYPCLPRGAAGPHPLHHRPRRGRDAGDRRATSSKTASPRSCAPGPTAWRQRSPRRSAGRGRGRSRRATPTPSRPPIAKPSPPSKRINDIAILERLSDERPRAVDLYRRDGDPRHAHQPEGLLARRLPAAVRTRAAARESRLPRRQRAHLPRRPAGRRGGRPRLAARHGAGARRRRRPRHRRDRGLDRGGDAGAVPRARRSRTRFNTLVLEAGLGWRDVAMVRAFGRYLRQIRVAFAPGLPRRRRSRATAPSRPRSSTLFDARFDPRGRRTARRGARARARAEIEALLAGGRRASTTTASCAASSTSSKRRCAPTSSRSTRTAGRADHRLQVRLRAGRRPAAAAARSARSSSIRRASRACICASARSRAAASAGPTGRRISAPRCSASSRRSRSRTPSSCRSAPRAASSRSSCRRRPTARPGSPRASRATRSSSAPCSSSPTTSTATAIVPPPDTVRHDGDDPYLVVAADKGTATFSDIANAHLARDGSWLGDAFASGGCQGYDHKKMGITARGAWEAVKRHFREMDIDIQTQPVTVVGVGDMSGDVFGNGMLLSTAIKLVAAFDHRDIFIDPDPDPERVLGRAQAPVRPAALELAGLRQGADLRRAAASSRAPRSRSRCRREARPRSASTKAAGDAGRGDERHPEGRGRPALVRRHRHLHPRRDRDRRRGRRPRQRRHPHHRRASSAPR